MNHDVINSLEQAEFRRTEFEERKQMEVCPVYLKFHIHGQEKQSKEPISSYLVGRHSKVI